MSDLSAVQVSETSRRTGVREVQSRLMATCPERSDQLSCTGAADKSSTASTSSDAGTATRIIMSVFSASSKAMDRCSAKRRVRAEVGKADIVSPSAYRVHNCHNSSGRRQTPESSQGTLSFGKPRARRRLCGFPSMAGTVCNLRFSGIRKR